MHTSYLSFGTPPHCFGLEKYTKKCINCDKIVKIDQNRPQFYVLYAKKYMGLKKHTTVDVSYDNLAVVKNNKPKNEVIII